LKTDIKGPIIFVPLDHTSYTTITMEKDKRQSTNQMDELNLQKRNCERENFN
jgi:hypothetical protein